MCVVMHFEAAIFCSFIIFMSVTKMLALVLCLLPCMPLLTRQFIIV